MSRRRAPLFRAARALLFIAGALALLSGCRGHPATPQECAAILDRIITLELHELGFRDPALVERKELELRRTLAAELRRCPGVKIKDSAMECVLHAGTVEDISHRCLR